MKKVKLFIPFFISLTFLGIIFSRIEINEIFNAVKSADIKYILLALPLFLLNPIILAWRWKKILSLLGVNINFKRIIKLYLASVPIAKFSPANSGDIIRTYYIKKEMSFSLGTGIIIFENLLDISVLSLMIIISGITTGNFPITILGAVIIVFIILTYALIPKLQKRVNGKWDKRLSNFLSVIKNLIKSPRALIEYFIYTALAWLNLLLVIKILFLSFGAEITYHQIFLAQPIIIILGLLPITFSGIGIREVGMAYMYAQYAPETIIISTALAHSFFAVIIFPLIALPFMHYILKEKLINNIHE